MKERKAFALLVFLALVMSCRPAEPEPEPANAVAPVRKGLELPALPVADPPMDREAILLAIVKAASAHASATDDSEAQRALGGRPFEFRIRFGCASGSKGEGALQAKIDAEAATVRLRALPDLAGSDPLVAPFAGEDFETVEGFWIKRPWMLASKCPRTVAAPADPPIEKEASTASTPPAPRVGIAQFFTATDSRTHQRRRRAYEATERLDDGEAPSAEGYDLVLSGRLRPLPDDRVIACRENRVGEAPACVVSVEFDRVWLERPDTREMLAEWGRS